MARKILVTVGVSLLREDIAEKEAARVGFENLHGGGTLPTLRRVHDQLKLEDTRKRQNPEYSFDPEDRQWSSVCTKLAKAITNLWQGTLDEKDKRKFSGAELASLKALHNRGNSAYPIQPDDEIYLLASDTPSGQFCAWTIAEVLRTGEIGLPRFTHVHRPKIIAGLRPDSMETFVAQGLPTAAQFLIEHRQNALLIGSGGYKGLLPYLGPVAMQLKVPLFYLYEDSAELLELNPLPVVFDLSVITQYKDTFYHVRPARGVARAKEFWAILNREAGPAAAIAEEQIKTMGLIRQIQNPTLGEDTVTLSATGALLYILAYLEKVLAGRSDDPSPLVKAPK